MLIGTARRLRLATGVLVLTFLATSGAALAGLVEMHGLLHQVKAQEERVRAALTLASAVRDQYAHQAHSIILGDTSHLPLYARARAQVATLLDGIERASVGPEEAKRIAAMRRASEKLDHVFNDRVVPALRGGDRSTLLDDHAELLSLITTVQDNADALAAKYEHSISEFEAHAREVQNITLAWTLGFVFAVVLLAFAVSGYIGRAVTRPLALLEAGTRRLAQGDLNARIEINRPDEFGRLAEQINRMTISLKEHQEKLIQSEKLAGIGRLAAGVAHEINNPIGVILGYARLLQRGASEAQRSDLKVIEDEALLCRDIVEGLLDLARPMKAGMESIDLRQLAEDVVARLRESGQFSEVGISFEGEAAAEGNAMGLRQMVTNLVKNAGEAAGPGGQVQVRLDTNEAASRIVVTDSGPGLTEEIQARMFEPFFTTKDTGTGLGLAISRAIAQAHRGEISVRNAPSGGAEFVIELPRRT